MFDVTEVLGIHFDGTFPEDAFSPRLPGVRFVVIDHGKYGPARSVGGGACATIPLGESSPNEEA